MVERFTLDQILSLVGPLDDAPGSGSARERFRQFLVESVTSVGVLRDYIEVCTRSKGPQYDHALQDLVNHAGGLIGFDVEYGRYRGLAGVIGFDGLWRWNSTNVIVEVKTTDAFSIATATLVGYIDQLISAHVISDWHETVGLYVFGRADRQLTQLANSIVAEHRTQQLRISTIEDVLSLAELVQGGQIATGEAVGLIKPGGVYISDTVDLLSRVVAQSVSTGVPSIQFSETPATPTPRLLAEESATTVRIPDAVDGIREALYLLTPVRDEEGVTAEETIRGLLGSGWYVFRDGTPGLKRLTKGDRIAFYSSGRGVVAEATVASEPLREPPPNSGLVKNVDAFPWSLRVVEPRYFFSNPVPIDADLRALLDAFRGRDPGGSWAWLVQGTKIVNEHDFHILTGRGST